MVNENSPAFKATHSAANNIYAGPVLPSIFDILSQESLTSSLKPALKSLIQVIIFFE